MNIAFCFVARFAGRRAPDVTSHRLGRAELVFTDPSPATYAIRNGVTGVSLPKGNDITSQSVAIRRCGNGYVTPQQVSIEPGCEAIVRCDEQVSCSLRVVDGIVVLNARDMRVNLSCY